jgi:hypothetical protein
LGAVWGGGRELDSDEKVGVDAVRRARHEVHLGVGGPFRQPERQVVRWTQTMTTDDLLGLAGTYSAVITMEPSARTEYLASMERFLETHELPGSEGAIDVPMRCLCWHTTLR